MELAEEIEEEYKKLWPAENTIEQSDDQNMEDATKKDPSKEANASDNDGIVVPIKEEEDVIAGHILACNLPIIKEEPIEMEPSALVIEEPREMEPMAPVIDMGVDDLLSFEELADLFKEFGNPELFGDIPEDLQWRANGLLP